MREVQLIVLDVDGTLTDGTLLYDNNGGEAKRFHIADGLGIVMAQCLGLQFAVLSGRQSPAVERRMAELGVTDLVQKSGDKAEAMRQILERYGLEAGQVAYIGDDLNDLPAFDVAGVKIAVADAAELLRERADWVTPRNGGEGAVRDAIDEILRRQGRYEEAVAAYLARSRDREAPRQ